MTTALRKAIDQNYSYRDRLKLDWDKLFTDATPRLHAATTPAQFAREAARLLEPAKDIHMSVQVNGHYLPTFRRNVPANINTRILPQVVQQLTQHNNTVWTGRLDGAVTYVAVHNWNANTAAHLEPAFDAIKNADPKAGIILDVRANSGGDELLARQVAGCFVSEPRVYSKNDIRKDGQFLGPYDRTVQPTKDRPHFKGKVAVLIGPYCMSSNESFINMMKVAGATLAGQRTYGSSANPKPHDLGKGVTVILPSWRDIRPDGTLLEGNGIPPDVEVKTTPQDFTTKDPVLDAALKHL